MTIPAGEEKATEISLILQIIEVIKHSFKN
jgi:hypothetical protein